MDQTLKDILYLLLNPTVTFFVGILTVLMARNNTVFSIARERLIYAYQPLFMEIEPFLYKKTTYNDIVPFLQKYLVFPTIFLLLVDKQLMCRPYRQNISYYLPRYHLFLFQQIIFVSIYTNVLYKYYKREI